MNLEALHREFAAPTSRYRMLPLLRIDDEVDEEQMRWQIRSLKEQGFGGIFSICERFHNGAPEPFVSDWWWNVVAMLAKLCAEVDIEFWVYDDEDWPSGSIGGQLIDENPDYQWKYLARDEHAVEAGPLTLKHGDGKLVAAVAFQKTVRSINPETLIDITKHVKDGELRWTVPAGDGWTVAFYLARPGKGIFIDGYGDLMDKKAMGRFVDWVYEGHRKVVEKVPGAKLHGYFTDEPAFSLAMNEWADRFHWYPSMPYSPEIGKYFKQLHGYDMEPKLPLLYYDVSPESLRFRCHYWATCCHMYSENYFGQIYRYCEERGMLSSGHLVVEESFHNHLCQQAGNLPTHFRNMHIPGIDWIHPFESFEHLPSTTPKYATSMAHLMGRERTWCESFAAAGWGLTFQQMRRIVNWEHVNGINMQIPITYLYSMRKRVDFYPPGISYQQPYWDHIRGFADYEARMCVLASGTGHVAQVALAYPSVDIQSHCWEHTLLTERGNAFNNLGDAIRRAGYDYDILDDQAIVDQAKVVDGLLATQTERFQVLVFPRAEAVRRATIERALELVKAGGMVIFVGCLPSHSFEHGSHDPELAKVIAEFFGRPGHSIGLGRAEKQHGAGRVVFVASESEAIATLRAMQAPDLLLPAGVGNLFHWHRRLDDGDLYLLFNYADQQREIEFSLGTLGHPERWNPETGEIEAIEHYEVESGRTRLKLLFQPMETIPVLLRAQRSISASPKPSKVANELALAGRWKFSIEETLARPYNAWNFTQKEQGWKFGKPVKAPKEITLGDWREHGLEFFSGLGIYEKEFELNDIPEGAQIELDLGGVAISAEVTVNDQNAGITYFAPYRINITPYVKAGKNKLKITVANTLANYFAQFAELQGKSLNQGGDLPERLVSGLLGPVSVRTYV